MLEDKKEKPKALHLMDDSKDVVFSFTVVKRKNNTVDLGGDDLDYVDLNEIYRCICDIKNQLENLRVIEGMMNLVGDKEE